MRYVYGIAFRGDEFIMVYHSRREGWEMPGGKVEAGESDAEAMRREFREEVGYEFVPAASMELSEGTVYAGDMGERAARAGEMDWCAFRELPEQLSFPQVEYAQLIDWARKEMARHRAGEREQASA